MENTLETPVVVGKPDDKPAQRPGLPKLVLAATRGRQTRQERATGRKPKGFAELDVGDFSARLLKYQQAQRRGPSRRKAREEKDARLKARQLRGFFPQKGTKVARADATPADQAKGRMYLTLENGQVINPAKLLAVKRRRRGLTDGNPVLVQKAVQFIDSRIPARGKALE